MDALAIILDAPERLSLRPLALVPLGAGDVLVEIRWSGISSGTEKLLWSGRMPAFPGMGYPLVPGYESVGRIVDAGADARARIGEWVYVPGATCWRDARGLFGGTASRAILPAARALPAPESLGRDGILLALAATARHAVAGAACSRRGAADRSGDGSTPAIRRSRPRLGPDPGFGSGLLPADPLQPGLGLPR